MPTGSTETGRWTAARMMPPGTPATEAAADGAPAEAAVVGAAPLAPGDAAGELQAAMIMPIEPIERPTIEARWMNSRRLRRPAANASMTSSCKGTAERRTLSNLG